MILITVISQAQNALVFVMLHMPLFFFPFLRCILRFCRVGLPWRPINTLYLTLHSATKCTVMLQTPILMGKFFFICFHLLIVCDPATQCMDPYILLVLQ